MALRNILRDGDGALRKKSRPVTAFDDRIFTLLDDMRETLIEANGLGLAATQVGVLRRAALVVDGEGEIIELLNPEIIEMEGEIEGSEGCLSFPGLYGVVARPEKVTVRAQDRFGNLFTVSGEGITARAFCHEIDHLNGRVFTEKVIRFLEPDEETEEGEEEDA